MKKIVVIFILIFSIPVLSQTDNSAKTESIDALVNEVLTIISGEKGKVRNWNNFRNLFIPTAKFTILNHAIDSLSMDYEQVSLDEFIELMHDQYYKEGFTEYELGKVINEYNGVANVFQSFYAKDSENEEGKGITSYQLIYFKNRWWITDLLWTTNSNGLPIPEKYLKN